MHHPCTFCGKEEMKMQEEVENRTLTLVVSGTKFTGRMFKAAISKYREYPILRSQTPLSRSLRKSPGNMVWIMR